jgi:hypothetical protein
MRRPPFLGEPGNGPGTTAETTLEVAAADEEQACVGPRITKGSACEFGDGAYAGPLVCRDNYANPHFESIAESPDPRKTLAK